MFNTPIQAQRVPTTQYITVVMPCVPQCNTLLTVPLTIVEVADHYDVSQIILVVFLHPVALTRPAYVLGAEIAG